MTTTARAKSRLAVMALFIAHTSAKLEVVSAGLCRTGSSSLNEALKQREEAPSLLCLNTPPSPPP